MVLSAADPTAQLEELTYNETFQELAQRADADLD
jgi:hypothetical protein